MTFFSGTDTATLRSEGKDANHFVSLIVNNEGVYTAAITRKVEAIIKGNRIISYNTFDDEHIDEDSIPFESTDVYIEYYMLNIIMPEVTPKSELEIRLEEVRKNAKSFINKKYNSAAPKELPVNPVINTGSNIVNPPKVEFTKPTYTELPLFSDKEMGKVKIQKDELSADDIPYGEIHINPNIIKEHIKTIITGDLFSVYKPSIEIDKWADNMESLYNKRFGSADNDNFKYWADNMLDFLAGEVHDEYIEQYGDDVVWAIWGYDLMVELESLPQNEYLKVIIKSVERWLI